MPDGLAHGPATSAVLTGDPSTADDKRAGRAAWAGAERFRSDPSYGPAMTDRVVVVFETEDVEAEARLVREYVVPAFRRLGDRADVRWLSFNRYGHDPSVDGGEVLFVVYGDAEAVAAAERDGWDDVVDAGLAEDWWIDDTEVRLSELDEEERLHQRIRATASRMAIEFFEEFEAPPDAIDEFSVADESAVPDARAVGWWLGLHYLVNQLGYQANDGEEEVDLFFRLVKNRLLALAVAPGHGPEAAEAKMDELLDELESFRPELHRFREEYGEHQHTYANREGLGKS